MYPHVTLKGTFAAKPGVWSLVIVSSLVGIITLLKASHRQFNINSSFGMPGFGLPADRHRSWPFDNASVPQDDPRLIEFIRTEFVIPSPEPPGGIMPEPSYWGDPNSTVYSKFGVVEGKLIPQIFFENEEPVRGGTFLEAGSVGQDLSATLYMERFLGWHGLVVEMVPLHLQKVMDAKRYRSKVMATCISPVSWPMRTNFTTYNKLHLVNPMATLIEPQDIDDGKNWAKDPRRKMKLLRVETECFPLYSILLAANLTTIDFCNLSLGGLEHEVLLTLPFDKVDIKVILFSLVNIKRQAPLIHRFMMEHNYLKVPGRSFLERQRDPLYVRKDFAEEKNIIFI